jgi:Uma2 family endonuclease
MTLLQSKIVTDTWIKASWDEYLQAMDNPDYEKAKFYYDQGRLRIEMSPLGNDHASDHSIISTGINLYSILKGISLNGKDNCTYKKAGCKSAQPDLSYYIGETVNAVPFGTSLIDLDEFPSPTLVIEVANSSLYDDLGAKRLLYETLGVLEYWIIDTQNVQIIAFSIADGGSKRITQSQALLGLDIKILDQALQKTRQENHSQVGAWLLKTFQEN